MTRQFVPSNALSLLLLLCFSVAASASSSTTAPSAGEQRKPDAAPGPELSPDQVVKTVMEAMQQNDDHDSGIETAFRFASPGNHEATGPLERFIPMVKSPAYSPMLNFKSIEYGPLQQDGDQAKQGIRIVASDGTKVTYLFILSKQVDAPFKDCWMTDGVVRLREPGDPGNRQPVAPGPAPVKT